MDLFLQRLFRDEVELQCRFVLLGKKQLDAPASNMEGWFALQAILVSAANISKLLWGSGGKKTVERQALRDSLGVEDSSPLQSADLRNDFEHFDERMALWFEDAEHKIYAGRNVGPDIHDLAPPGVRHFGHYEPATGVVTFWENSISLFEIVDEARNILAAIEGPGHRPAADSS